MIVIRNRKTNKLVEVYSGIADYIESPDYCYYVNDNQYRKINKYPHELSFEELNKARANRIV